MSSSSAARRAFAVETLRKMLQANAQCRRRRVFLSNAEVVAIIAAIRALERRTP